MQYYEVSSGADIGGRAGVAYIQDFNGIDLLPKQGLVDNWSTKHFFLKEGEYTDYLTANIGCRLCSQRLHDVLEKCKSEGDIIQWLDAEVESESGEKRPYFILHFPVLFDAIDKKRSKYVRDILTKQIINPKVCVGHTVFGYIEESRISFTVSETVRKELKRAGCTGLMCIRRSPQEKTYIPSFIHAIYSSLFNKKESKQPVANTSWKETTTLNIPNELVQFLSLGKTLSYDKRRCAIGNVELVSVESLVLGKVYVESPKQSLKKGYYTIPAVDIIAECEGFDAWGILVWLPDQKKFGTWDSDHRQLRVFCSATWTDIAEHPVRYLNALWKPQEAENFLFEPDDRYPFTSES